MSKYRCSFSIFTAISFFQCFLFVPAFAQEVPANIKFSSIHTPHFEVIVNAEQQLLGQHYANQLEKAYLYTTSLIQDRPEKTVVIINDKWDITNGYATRVPYPHIMIYPVLPGAQDSLSEGGDWTLELLAHEYTHILNFEPAPGLVGFLRLLFGSVMAPNILLPTWWKEGVAVQIESSISSGGRLRSIYQDSMLRAFVLAGKLKSFDIAQINEVLPNWPEGMRSYLFGSVMWSQMVADQGPEVMNKLFQRQGGRVPYFIEAPAQDLLGQSYLSEYKKALDETEARVHRQLQALRLAPPTTDFPLEMSHSENLSNPAISPNGNLMALIARDFNDSRSVRIFARNPTTNDFVKAKEVLQTESESDQGPGGKVYDGPPAGSISRVSWFNKSRKILYDKIDWVNSIERYSDLYVFDLDTRKTQQLSRKMRAREPAVSLDDLNVVFIRLSANQTALSLIDLTTRKVETLVQGSPGQRLSYPNFLSAREIVYSASTVQGIDELWIYDLSTRKARKWGGAKGSPVGWSRFPVPTKDGLLINSSLNGVANIYLLGKKEETPARPLTHTLTGYSTLTVDPLNGDIYGTKMTEKGPWVHRIPQANQLNPSLSQLPTVTPLFADRYPARDAGPVGTEVYPVKEYGVGNSLWPKYWIPFIATTANGPIFQASTSGFDPLKRHQYSASAAWDSTIKKGSFAGAYQNSVWTWPWFLQSSVTNTALASSTDILTSSSSLLGVSPSLFSVHRDLTMSLALKYNSFETVDFRHQGIGPTLSLAYSNISQGGVQISPEHGKSLTFSATKYIENKNDLNHSQYLMSGSAYTNKWLPERHALMVKVSGMHTPEEIDPRYGASTSSLALSQDGVGPQFLIRGYLPGHFLGRNMINTNLEYRFPLRDIDRGYGTDPIFIRRLHGALIADGVATQGYGYYQSQAQYIPTKMSEQFWSLGAELRLETTIGYVLPVQFVVYGYAPQNSEVGGDASVGLTLQMTQSF